MNADRGRRVGIFGGTFDPVHIGHVSVAEECAARLRLDEVLLIPSYLPPHRPAPVASATDRMQMVRLAAGGHERLRASDVEVARGGISYSIDTVHELNAQAAGQDFVFLLGWDAALEFATWQGAAELATLVRFAIFNRSGAPPLDRDRLVQAGLPADTELLTVDSPDISATQLRAGLRAGEDVSDLVPAAVLGYVREHGLYGAVPRPAPYNAAG